MDFKKMNDIEILNKIENTSLDEMESVLKEFLLQAKDSYYNDVPFVSDHIYDMLEEKYTEITGKELAIGSEVSDRFEKVKHSIEMGSLKKENNKEGFLKWVNLKKLEITEEEKFFLEQPKYDGYSLSIEYENGELSKIISRGDGVEGNLITKNALKFNGVPKTISDKSPLVAIRGEGIIYDEVFERDLSNIYKNTRNALGCINTLNGENCEFVDFVAYNIQSKYEKFKTEEEKLLYLKKMGFTISDYRLVSIEDIENTIDNILDIMEKKDVRTDGIVIKVNDCEYSEILKESLHPEYQVAIKPPNILKKTILKDVEFSIGNSGVITPVAIFEPVNIDGVIITRSTLANFRELKKLEEEGFGIGSEILVARNNMVIPHVHGVISKGIEVQKPNKCPCCNEDLTETTEEDNKIIIQKKCMNLNCPEVSKGRILNFAKTIKIVGFSEGIIDRFYEEGYIKNPLDIFKLTEYENELMKLSGFGEKSIKKLLNSIKSKNSFTLENFLSSIGIENFGSKQFEKAFDSRLIQINYDNGIKIDIDRDKFLNTKGFGEKMLYKLNSELNRLSSIIINVFDKNNYFSLSNFDYEKNNYIYKNEAPIDTSNFIKVVMTGDLDEGSFKNRKEFENYLKSNGYLLVDTVSKDTKYLICNEENSTSSKFKKAQKLEVPILTQNKIMNLIKNGNIKMKI